MYLSRLKYPADSKLRADTPPADAPRDGMVS